MVSWSQSTEKVLDYLLMGKGTRASSCNGDKDGREDVGDGGELGKEEANIHGINSKGQFHEPRLPRSAVPLEAM